MVRTLYLPQARVVKLLAAGKVIEPIQWAKEPFQMSWIRPAPTAVASAQIGIKELLND